MRHRRRLMRCWRGSTPPGLRRGRRRSATRASGPPWDEAARAGRGRRVVELARHLRRLAAAPCPPARHESADLASLTVGGEAAALGLRAPSRTMLQVLAGEDAAGAAVHAARAAADGARAVHGRRAIWPLRRCKVRGRRLLAMLLIDQLVARAAAAKACLAQISVYPEDLATIASFARAAWRLPPPPRRPAPALARDMGALRVAWSHGPAGRMPRWLPDDGVPGRRGRDDQRQAARGHAGVCLDASDRRCCGHRMDEMNFRLRGAVGAGAPVRHARRSALNSECRGFARAAPEEARATGTLRTGPGRQVDGIATDRVRTALLYDAASHHERLDGARWRRCALVPPRRPLRARPDEPRAASAADGALAGRFHARRAARPRPCTWKTWRGSQPRPRTPRLHCGATSGRPGPRVVIYTALYQGAKGAPARRRGPLPARARRAHRPRARSTRSAPSGRRSSRRRAATCRWGR